jgi:hypothetical protein
MIGMERRVRVFKSHEEAERANRETYAAMSAEQRFQILFELIERRHGPQQGFERVCRVLRRQRR